MSPARRAGGLLPRRHELPMIAWMVLVYLGLLGTFTVKSVLSAVVVALLLRAVMPLPQLPGNLRVSPAGLARLLGYLAVDLVRSSAQVFWLAVRPGPAPTTALVAVPLRTHSDVLVVTTSQLLSLAPGSILVDLDVPSSTLFLHVLGVDGDPEAAALRGRVDRLERLVTAALGSPADRQLCQAPLPRHHVLPRADELPAGASKVPGTSKTSGTSKVPGPTPDAPADRSTR